MKPGRLRDGFTKKSKKYVRRRNASYETAQIGTVKLVPSGAAIKDLSMDYDHMKDMIYGEKPSFDEIMETLAKLEAEINRLAR